MNKNIIRVIAPILIAVMCLVAVTTVSAQTTTDTFQFGTTSTTTPGLPDTGVGSATALNIGLIVAALVVILGGAALIATQRTV